MKPIKVLLAEDHVMVREGTRELLERHKDIEVVGEAGNGQEAVDLTLKLHPDVVLMDFSMPVLNGLEATRLIKAQAPTIAILVLSAYDDDSYVFALLEAHAAGYLLKTARADEVADAIRAVHSGESVLHPSIASKVLRRLAEGHEAPSSTSQARESLSQRELEVLEWAGRGLSNKEIAAQLVISPRTVQAHMSNIFGKLQVGSRTEAILHALRQGWLSLEESGPRQDQEA